MMRLARFSVKNYRQFANSFVLDLRDVRDYRFNCECIKNNIVKTGIIYGKNAVGKTNFGLAIMDIAYHLAFPDVAVASEVSQVVNYLNADSDCNFASFEYLFDANGQKIAYSYEKRNAFSLKRETLSVDGQLIFDFYFDNPDYGNVKTVPGLENFQWELRNREMSLIRFIAYNSSLAANHPIKLIADFAKRMLWFKNVDKINMYAGFSAKTENIMDYIINEKLVDELNDFLHDHEVNESFAEVSVGEKKALMFKHKQMLPDDVASSGTRSLVLFYYWYKHFSEASFVFADEFDAFYHTEVAHKIVQLAKKCGVQILFTSHNTNLMNTRLMRPDCYFIMTKERIVSFANATQRELREGHNLEKLYLSGEFGD